MKRVYLTIGVVFLLAFLSTFAVAKPGAGEGKRGYGAKSPDRMHRGGPGGETGHVIEIILRLEEKLGLDTKQVEQLTAIKNEGQGQFKANAEAVKVKRDALRKAIESGASEAVIRAAAGEIGNAIGDQAVLRGSTKAKIDGILTGDQKAKLEELKKQQTESRKGQRGQGKRGTSKDTKGRRGPGKKARDPESAFARIDTDGNGTISLEEFKIHVEQMKERSDDRRPRGQRRTKPEEPAGKSDD